MRRRFATILDRTAESRVRSAFRRRPAADAQTFRSPRGLGRVAADFAPPSREESAAPARKKRRQAWASSLWICSPSASVAEPERQSADEKSVRTARLNSVKAYIETHLGDPDLSPAVIAKQNGISLRYLHHLFRPLEVTVSDWLRLRRLERCREMLSSPLHAHKSITEIAFSMGFSSSSHFSNLFRAQFDLRPSDLRGVRFAERFCLSCAGGVGQSRIKTKSGPGPSCSRSEPVAARYWLVI